MRRRRVASARSWAACAVVAVVAGLLSPAVARADTPAETGWWFAGKQAPLPVDPPVPLAPEGGIYVSNAADRSSEEQTGNGPAPGTLAYGAVRYFVPAGSTGVLVLTAADGSTTIGVDLQACRTTSAWSAADGGPYYEKPTFDLTACIPGEPGDDTTTISFAVPADMTVDGFIDLAIAPATGATSFSIAFAPPGDDSLTTEGGGFATPDDPATPAPQPDREPIAAPQGGFFPPVTSFADGVAEPQAEVALPSSETGDAPAPVTGNVAAVDPILGGGPMSVVGWLHGPSGTQRGPAVLLLLLLGAAWWWVTRHARAGRLGLGARSAPEAEVLGVGRFARAREGPTPTL